MKDGRERALKFVPLSKLNSGWEQEIVKAHFRLFRLKDTSCAGKEAKERHGVERGHATSVGWNCLPAIETGARAERSRSRPSG